MEAEKTLSLKTLDGKDVVFTIRTLVSEWDLEQISAIYEPYMVYNPEKFNDQTGEKGGYEFNKDKGTEAYVKKNTRLLELFVTKWNGSTENLTPENIKKTLNREEFTKLNDEVNKIYKSQTLSEEKKSPTPNNSSELSATSEAPTSPENS